jgi:hypothetical protein
MRPIVGFTIATLLIAIPSRGNAQFMLMVDAGQRQDLYGTGFTRSIPYGGIGLGAVIQGLTGEKAALLLSAAGEGKFGAGGLWDAKVNGDAMIRLGPLAFGGGVDLLLPNAGDVDDRTSSDGKRTVIDLELLGYSGIAKLNFGPLNKAFVQGRFTTYPQSGGLRLINGCSSEYLSEDVAQSCEQSVAEHEPAFLKGDEARVSAGWVFSSSGGSKILRAQVVQQRINYVSEKDNIGGAYNRTIRTFTLGLVFGL